MAANDTPSPASGSATRAIRQLEISAFAEDENVECRKEAPTGSLIKVERCYPVGVARTAHEAALGEVARQELETMRQRQMYREQARRARDQAIRQISRQRY